MIDGLTVFPYELTTLYESFTLGQASPLPKLNAQYADFARWQRCRVTGDVKISWHTGKVGLEVSYQFCVGRMKLRCQRLRLIVERYGHSG